MKTRLGPGTGLFPNFNYSIRPIAKKDNPWPGGFGIPPSRPGVWGGAAGGVVVKGAEGRADLTTGSLDVSVRPAESRVNRSHPCHENADWSRLSTPQGLVCQKPGFYPSEISMFTNLPYGGKGLKISYIKNSSNLIRFGFKCIAVV